MERKPYSGNGRPFVYAMFLPEDREGAERVLEAMREKGFDVWPEARFDKRRIDKSALLLLILTPAAAANDAVGRAINYAAQTDHPLLAVYLKPTALNPAQRLLLNTQQGILRHECASEEAFFEKLFGSALLQNLRVTPAQKRAAGQTTWSLAGGILVAAALAVYLALGVGATVSEDSLLAGLGFQGKMADIHAIYVYGEAKKTERGEGVVTGVLYDEKEKTLTDAVFFNKMYDIDPFGDITDVSDFGQLKNLRELSLAGNRITDASPLWNLRKLEYLDLTGNPVESLEGVAVLQNLTTICIGGTQVGDITPLDSCGNLKQVHVDPEQYKLFIADGAAHAFELVPVGPKEELKSLSAHIFGGAEENGGDYGVFIKTKSWNVYKDYTYEILKNGSPVQINGKQEISSFGKGKTDKVHLNLNQTSFGAYDTNANYTLTIHYQDWSATYRICNKLDAAYPWASSGILIETSGF